MSTNEEQFGSVARGTCPACGAALGDLQSVVGVSVVLLEASRAKGVQACDEAVPAMWVCSIQCLSSALYSEAVNWRTEAMRRARAQLAATKTGGGAAS